MIAIGCDHGGYKLKEEIKKYLDENFDFDVKGGAIINDEGNYQYLKILDIRKNEHFGCVFMTLNRPCPLSLQVKSKIAELFLLKKYATCRNGFDILKFTESPNHQ